MSGEGASSKPDEGATSAPDDGGAPEAGRVTAGEAAGPERDETAADETAAPEPDETAAAEAAAPEPDETATAEAAVPEPDEIAKAEPGEAAVPQPDEPATAEAAEPEVGEPAGNGPGEPAGNGPGEPPPTPADHPPASDAPAWWRRRSRQGRADEPWSHVSRAMAYEVLVVLVTAAALAVIAFVVLQGRFQDLYLNLRHQAPVTDEVTLLTVGPEALYLWDPSQPEPATTPRPLLTHLVRFLDSAGAEVVVLDLLLDQPASGDEELAAAARAHGAVLGAERLVTTQPATGRQFVAGLAPSLLDGLDGGVANFQAESVTLFSDEVLVRRVPLVAQASRAHLEGTWPANQVGGRQDIDQVVPALGLLAAWLHRARAEDPDASPERLHGLLQERCASAPLRCDLEVADLGLPPVPGPLARPLDINFRGPEHADGVVAVPAARVLRVLGQHALMRQLGADPALEVPEDLRAVLDGRIVIVGRVDAAAQDRFVTPYGYPVPIEPDMAGPRIHAHIVDTLLSGRHLRPIGGLPVWISGLLLAAAVGGSYRRVRDDVLVLGWLLVAALLVAGGALLFIWTDGMAVDLGPPLFGLFGALFVLVLRGWAFEESRRT